jgi:hypothetical protein
MLSPTEFVNQMLDAAAEHGIPALVKFELRPPVCPPQCREFHKTYYFRFNPDGTIEFQDSPYGFHSVAFPHPSFHAVDFDDAVRIIEKTLQEQESLSGRRDDLAEIALLAKLELAYLTPRAGAMTAT